MLVVDGGLSSADWIHRPVDFFTAIRKHPFVNETTFFHARFLVIQFGHEFPMRTKRSFDGIFRMFSFTPAFHCLFKVFKKCTEALGSETALLVLCLLLLS